MTKIFFDIETGPLPDSELDQLMPPFDPAEVKTGNIKDPEKIAEKIRQSELDHRRAFVEGAALDARYGRILAIGVIKDGEFSKWLADDYTETEMLTQFWHFWRMNNSSALFIGFNIFLFDLPFLMRRSWKLGIPLPICIRRGRYWNEDFIDLRELWQLGDRQAHGSLDSIAKHLCVGAKNGNGKNFANLLTENRQAAIEYLLTDLRLLERIAAKIIDP